MNKNPWLKLAVLSFTGIIISFALLWGIQQFNGSQYNYNQGYMNQSQYGVMQNNANMQGSTNSGSNMNSGSQSGMGMMDDKMDDMMGSDM